MIRAFAIVLGITAVRGDSIVKSTYSGSNDLNDLAKVSGKYMETAVDQDLKDSAALKVLKKSHDFGMLTPGNCMKWDATGKNQNVFSFDSGDALVTVAKEIGAKVRCHTLTWAPQWVQSLSKQEMLSVLENHITKVMTHFGDSCYAWDVANEVMGDDAQMRESFWYTTTGMDFLSTPFKTANSIKKSLGLKTKLYYNDYNTNTINAKSTAVLKMIKGLQDEGIIVDGVGFQSHFGFADTASSADQAANFERFTALGLDAALTEDDVTASSSSPSAEEQTQQSNVYKNTVAACKQVKKCVGVTIWGYDDNYSRRLRSHGTSLVGQIQFSLYDGIVAGWGGSSSSSSSKTGAREINGTSQTPTPSSGTNTHSWNFGTTNANTPGTVGPSNGNNNRN